MTKETFDELPPRFWRKKLLTNYPLNFDERNFWRTTPQILTKETFDELPLKFWRNKLLTNYPPNFDEGNFWRKKLLTNYPPNFDERNFWRKNLWRNNLWRKTLTTETFDELHISLFMAQCFRTSVTGKNYRAAKAYGKLYIFWDQCHKIL